MKLSTKLTTLNKCYSENIVRRAYYITEPVWPVQTHGKKGFAWVPLSVGWWFMHHSGHLDTMMVFVLEK